MPFWLIWSLSFLSSCIDVYFETQVFTKLTFLGVNFNWLLWTPHCEFHHSYHHRDCHHCQHGHRHCHDDHNDDHHHHQNDLRVQVRGLELGHARKLHLLQIRPSRPVGVVGKHLANGNIGDDGDDEVTLKIVIILNIMTDHDGSYCRPRKSTSRWSSSVTHLLVFGKLAGEGRAGIGSNIMPITGMIMIMDIMIIIMMSVSGELMIKLN